MKNTLFLPASLAFCCISTGFGAQPIEPAKVLSAMESSDSGAVDFDLAKLHSHARIVYVSSGPKTFALRMIDNDGRTAYRFSDADLHPTVVVQLAGTEKIHRVSTVFPEQAARLDVYLTNQLPKEADELRFLTPVVSIMNPTGDGKAIGDFAPQDARYVTLRWTRLEGHGVFKVAEISAFGGGAFAFLTMDVTMPLPSQTTGILPVVPVVSPD